MAPPSDDNYDRIGRSKTLTNNAEPPSATNPRNLAKHPTETIQSWTRKRTDQPGLLSNTPHRYYFPRDNCTLTKRHLTSLVLLLLLTLIHIIATTMVDVVMLDAPLKGKRPASSSSPLNPSKKAPKGKHASPQAKQASFSIPLQDPDEAVIETTANPSLYKDTLDVLSEEDKILATHPYVEMFGEGSNSFHDDLNFLTRIASRQLYKDKQPTAKQFKDFSEDKGEMPLFPKLSWTALSVDIIQNSKNITTFLNKSELIRAQIICYRLGHTPPTTLFGKVSKSTVNATHASRAWLGAIHAVGSFYIKPKSPKPTSTKKGQKNLPLAGQQLITAAWLPTPGKSSVNTNVITPENPKHTKLSATTKANTIANSSAANVVRDHHTRLQIMIKIKSHDTTTTNDLAINLIKALFKRYKENDATACILPWKIDNMKSAPAIHKVDKIPTKMSELKKLYTEGLHPKANSNNWFKLHIGSTEKGINFTSLNESEVQDFFMDNECVAYLCSVQESDDTVDLCDLLYSGPFMNAADFELCLRKYMPGKKFGCRTKKTKEIPEPKHSKDWLLKPNMMLHIESNRRDAKPIKTILHKLFNAPPEGTTRPSGYNVRVLPAKNQLKLGTKGDSDRLKMLQKHKAIVSSLTVFKSYDLKDLNLTKNFNDQPFSLREHLLKIKWPLGELKKEKTNKTLFFSVDYAPSGIDRDQGAVYFTAYNDRADIASKLVDILPAFMKMEYGAAQAKEFCDPSAWGEIHNTEMQYDDAGNWLGEWTTPDDAMGEDILNEDMGVEISFDNMALLDEGFNTRVLLMTEDASVCTFGMALGRVHPNNDQSDTVVPGASQAAIDSDSDSTTGVTEISGAVAD